MLEDHFGEGVDEFQEAQVGRLVMLPVVTLPPGCDPSISMAVFVANDYQGYPTRLFLERPIRLRSGAIPSTTPAYMLGRTLYAASIGGISANLPTHQAILAHIRRYALDS